MRTSAEILVISPFRRPDFRHAVTPSHPFEEPWDSPPFVLAGACEAAGFNTAVLALQNVYTGFDETRDIEGLRTLLARYRPRLVLFSGDHFIPSRSTATVYGIDVIARLLRSQGSPAIGVCGRLATTIRAELLKVTPDVDFLVIGEAEQVIADIVTSVVRSGISAVSRRPDVITRQDTDRDDAIVPAFVTAPDSLPLPAFHLAGRSIDLLTARRMFDTSGIAFSLRTSFGCKFRCRFCAGVPHWTEYRTKSEARIAAEVDHLYRSLPEVARLSFLEDEIATRHAGHVRSLATVLRDRNIRLDGLYTHASLLTAEVAETLQPVVARVFLGLDSPQDDILRQMGKGQRLDTVLAAVNRAHDAGLGVHLEWIIGSPADTVDSVITSLHAIFTLVSTGAVDNVNTYVFCPHPGTDYAENAASYDVVVHERFEMLESGGYPAASSGHLSRRQIFTAYLISQLIIEEARRARPKRRAGALPRPPVRAELARMFAHLGGR